MLIGRDRECSRLRGAILAKQSLLLWGPPASGKSALLQEVLASLPGEIRRKCLICHAASPPHAVWVELIRALAHASDPLITSRLRAEVGSLEALDSWLCRQTSLRMRGLIHRATRAGDYFVFFDPPRPLSDGIYRMLQMWCWSGKTPVYLSARTCDVQGAGKCARLFWHDGLRLALDPLSRSAGETLLAECIERFELGEVADGAFREFALSRSALLPGAVERICALASLPQYRWHGRLKLHTLAVDCLRHDPLVSGDRGKGGYG